MRPPVTKSPLGEDQGCRGSGRNLRGELKRRLAVLSCRYEAIDDSEPLGFVGSDPSTGQDEVRGDTPSGSPAEELRPPSSGDQSDRDFWQSDDGGLVGDDEIAGESELEPAPNSEAVQTADDGKRELRE